MAISTAQWTDLLVKKLFGVAKTAPESEKSPSNEAIASPAFIRGDVVWVESNQIPGIAQAVANIANVRTGTNAVKCIGDNTAGNISGTYQTWKTNVSYWIPQEFGSTWLPKVYVGSPSAANIEATGTQIFAAGSGGTGEYFFDTQAGVLNFIGGTIPTVLSGNVANVVYVSGYEYIGLLGTENLPGNTQVGNIVIANTTITTDGTVGNITIEPTGTGFVIIDTTTGLIIPSGNTIQRPASPEAGTIRWNSNILAVEVWDGTQWEPVGQDFVQVTSQIINGDGSTTVFTLDNSTTSAAIIVSTNGVLQYPDIAYTVAGNLITFAEAPQVSDQIDVRFTTSVSTVSAITNTTGNAEISVSSQGVANISTCDSLQLPTYTVAQASNIASPASGQIIYVSNGDTGNPCLAVYSGGTWKRVSLGATIST